MNKDSELKTEDQSSTRDQDTHGSQPCSKPNVIGWQFLPAMPEINKEVLVAIKYDEIPVQAFWDGNTWNGSFVVTGSMRDGYVNDSGLSTVAEYIYAWCELPDMPPVPEPF